MPINASETSSGGSTGESGTADGDDVVITPNPTIGLAATNVDELASELQTEINDVKDQLHFKTLDW